VIYADAFNDFSVPFHLTTVEFNQRIKDWLNDDGIYLINLVDGPKAKFLSAYTHTLRQTFSYVYAGIDPHNWRKYRSTHVLAASNIPLDLEAMKIANKGVKPPEHSLMGYAQTASLLATQNSVTLSDRYAPVDQLLASVFKDFGEE
jgi:spermidine synthase